MAKVETAPVSPTAAPNEQVTSIRDVDPNKRYDFSIVRDDSAPPLLGEVEGSKAWYFYWSHEKLLQKRLQNGYRFVTADCVVSHDHALGDNEVRILGPWKPDVAGRVTNFENMYLLAIPKWRHEETARRRQAEQNGELDRVVKGNFEEDFKHLKDARAVKTVEEGTFAQNDPNPTSTGGSV
jgi:hypothetical protein